MGILTKPGLGLVPGTRSGLAVSAPGLLDARPTAAFLPLASRRQFFPSPPPPRARAVSRCGPRVSEQRRTSSIHQLPGTRHHPPTSAAGVNTGLATTEVEISEECNLSLVKSWELIVV